MGYSPTDDEKKEVFRNSMWYEIVYTFGVPEHDPWDYFQWEMINFTRMGHARVLYAFLETDTANRFKDDVLAIDYGYPAGPVALSASDRERLNKDLFHFSYGRLRHTPATKPWPDSILGNLLDPVLGFMRYIRDSKPDIFQSTDAKRQWAGLIGWLESGRELGVRSWITVDGKQRYQFALGRPLPDGKPALTVHTRVLEDIATENAKHSRSSSVGGAKVGP